MVGLILNNPTSHPLSLRGGINPLLGYKGERVKETASSELMGLRNKPPLKVRGGKGELHRELPNPHL
jgi:hypothetical protein